MDHDSVGKVWTARLANYNGPATLKGQSCNILTLGLLPDIIIIILHLIKGCRPYADFKTQG